MRRKADEIQKILAIQSKNFETICKYLDEDLKKAEYFSCKTYLKHVETKNMFTIKDNLIFLKRIIETIRFVQKEELDILEKKIKRFYRDKEYFETSIRLNEKILADKNIEISKEIIELIEETNKNSEKLIVLFNELFSYLISEVKRLRVRESNLQQFWS